MKFVSLVALALFASAALVRGQTPLSEDEKALWDAQNAWDQACLKGDAEAVGRFEAKGYQETLPDGTLASRLLGLSEIKSGEMTYQLLGRHETAARIEGDTAILTGRIAAQVTLRGQPLQGIFAFTDTWIKREGQWLALASQVTALAPTARIALEPVPRDAGWVRRHEGFVQIAQKGDVDVLFLGDSITDFWRNRGLTVFNRYFAQMKVANFGISGDRTEHVLWRIENGELDGIHPKVIMLMIGTNNVGTEKDGVTLRNTPHEAAEGVKAIVAELRKRLPRSKILLLAVFPRGHLPTDPVRIAAAQINPEIAGLADRKQVTYLDFNRQFLTPDGMLEKTIMPDFLHPNEAGYEIWARAVKGPLAKLTR